MIICLITGSYPYDIAVEDTFLKEEVEIMSKIFEEAHIMPKYNLGSRSILPPSLRLDNGLAIQLKSLKKLSIASMLLGISILFSFEFYREIFRKQLFPGQIKNLKWLVSYQLKRKIIERFIFDWILRNNYSEKRILFYTFWLDDATHGVSDAIAPFSKNMKVISRGHGFDIYEERVVPPYWPFRPLWFCNLDGVFADSKAGRDYLVKKYPQYANKFYFSPMGVSECGFITSDSRDNVLRVVSCSMMRRLKRIDLIMTSIKRFSLLYPDIPIVWTHFGDETAELSISDLMTLKESLEFNAKVKINFPGYDSQEALYSFYQSNFIDCFINVSESEGTPISILEALNCGIPIIATAVGGISDLVSKDNGYLLPKNPSEDQVCDALYKMYLMRKLGKVQEMKRASKLRWSTQYNSKVNHIKFFKRIQEFHNSADMH